MKLVPKKDNVPRRQFRRGLRNLRGGSMLVKAAPVKVSFVDPDTLR